MKVCFETFGCRLNRAEALDEEAKYLAAGWEVTESHADADRFVIRGCSVTARAQRECEKLLDHLKRKYPNKRIIIQGCLEKSKPSGSIISFFKNRPKAEDIQVDETQPIPVPTRTARAYLKVQDGCSGKCTFCIVPKFRGTSVSVDYDTVLDKAKRFIDAGYHEIVVTGCNLSLYASQGKRLPDLLSDLARVGNNACRIRLGSLEPGACALEAVHVLAEHDNICNFLHLPIQSGSNRILLAMRRPYLIKDVEQVVHEAKSLMPNLGLGCDLMTGFPGETATDFAATQALLLRMPFSNAHVFPYSERPGTPAETFADVISKEERSARAHDLARIIDGKRREFTKRFIGQEVDVVIEDEKHQAGWTAEYLWFHLDENVEPTETSPRKALVRHMVKQSRHGHLIG